MGYLGSVFLHIVFQFLCLFQSMLVALFAAGAPLKSDKNMNLRLIGRSTREGHDDFYFCPTSAKSFNILALTWFEFYICCFFVFFMLWKKKKQSKISFSVHRSNGHIDFPEINVLTLHFDVNCMSIKSEGLLNSHSKIFDIYGPKKCFEPRLRLKE